MKSHVLAAHATFRDGCDRAEGLRHIFKYLDGAAPTALNCDDILRSALVLSVSSFDLFIHDLFRTEIVHRLQTKRYTNLVRIPFNALISDEQARVDMIGDHIRLENSHKSFVAPGKLAECLSIIVEKPWDKIEKSIPTTNPKSKLKSVVDLRNRIAHEADVNPAYSGVELWPIYIEDVDASIAFLRVLGETIARIVDDA